jgi:flavin-dependent dehydrogenase
MYDIIVVGARCAGSPTAMLLASKGYRVLLLDRTTFPSDTLSTHIVWPPGVARLARWGLLDAVAASNCPAFGEVSFDVGPFALVGSPPPIEGAAASYAPRRKVVDTILVEAAVRAGAEFWDTVAVQEIAIEDGRVTGVRGRSRAGSTIAEQARIVVGADGLHSLVARAVQPSEYSAKPALSCWYYTYWSGVPAVGVEYYVRPGRAFGVIPTNDGLVCIPAAWTRAEFQRYRSDVEHNYLATLELAPELAERVRRGRREERFFGTADVPSYFRTPYGPGWALVGDAGYHKDPITGQGISDAFRDAALLADALDKGLSGRRPVDEALAAYQEQRDSAAMPMYEFTSQMATLDEPPQEMQRLLGALRHHQAETDRFFGTLAGTVSIPGFFAPENVHRIIGA